MLFILFNCSVTNEEIGKTISSVSASRLSEEDNTECKLYQSYQYDYWKNRNYRRTIYCNMYMMEELGCDGSEKHKPNYYNLSRSFIELENPQPDSAYWALKQGLKINKNDESLLELGAYVSRKSDNVENQIYYLDRVVSINESNARVLEQLCDVYGQERRYEDQIIIIDLWLKLEIDDEIFYDAKYNHISFDEGYKVYTERDYSKYIHKRCYFTELQFKKSEKIAMFKYKY